MTDDNPTLELVEQIDEAVSGKSGGSLVGATRMCRRWLIDPSLKGIEATERGGIMACICLLEGNTSGAERQAERNPDHWISVAVLKHIKKGAGGQEAARRLWSEVSRGLKPVVQLNEHARPAVLVV